MLEKKFQNIVLLAKRNATRKSNHIKAYEIFQRPLILEFEMAMKKLHDVIYRFLIITYYYNVINIDK